MSWFGNLFKKKPVSRLGIDLGSSAVKIVEITNEEGKAKLQTYGLAYYIQGSGENMQANNEAQERISIENLGDNKESFFSFGPALGENLTILSGTEIGAILKKLLIKSKVQSSVAYFSLPSFTIFSTVIELPPMPENELAAAIPFEAKKFIPTPLDDVVLDWYIVGTDNAENAGNPRLSEGDANLNAEQKQDNEDVREEGIDNEKAANNGKKVFVVAILKKAIEKYSQIAQMAGLEIMALEPESFSLSRVLAGEKNIIYILVDLGSSFADITFIENGSVRFINSIKNSVHSDTKQINSKFLVVSLKKVLQNYQKENPEFAAKKSVKCVLTGGSVFVSDLAQEIEKELNLEIIIGNPFEKISYPEVLEPAIKELGPALSVATGLAMRE